MQKKVRLGRWPLLLVFVAGWLLGAAVSGWAEPSAGNEMDDEAAVADAGTVLAAEPVALRPTIKLLSVETRIETGQPVVMIRTTHPVRYSVNYLTKPNRVLIKVLGAVKTWPRSIIPVKNAGLEKIRLAQHDQDVWVVLDVNGGEKWRINSLANGLEVRPATTSVMAKNEPIGPEPIIDPDTIANMPRSTQLKGVAANASYQVVDVVLEDLGEKTRVVITNDGQARYRVERDRNGRRLRMKFYSAGLVWPGMAKSMTMGAVRRIAAQQVNERGEPVVILDLDLVSATSYWVFKEQNQVMVELTNPAARFADQERGSLSALVSVDLQDAELKSVLRALAQEAGFDVVLTPNSQKVEGESSVVTLSINQQPLRAVLDYVLRPRKLAYAVSGNTLRIGLASEFPTETQVFTLKNLEVKNSNLKDSIEAVFADGAKGKVILEPAANRVVVSAIPSDMARVQDVIREMDVQPRIITQSFAMNYAAADKLMPMIQPLLSSMGSAKINEGENTLVVTDIPGNMNQVARLIRNLDTRAEQVMIEARIVEVSRSNELDLGVRWNASHANANRDPRVSASSIPVVGGSVGQITVGTLREGLDLNATLSALESKGKVNILSNPRIATLNKQSATLTASQNIPYATSSVSNGVVSNNVTYLELPIALNVTPQITKDRQVLLNPMTLTVTTVTGAGSPPPTSTRSASTQMVVADGETIAIGGMVRDEEVVTESKVPLLGDIPLVGMLFRGTTNTKNKVELVVFLTTHILE